MPRTIHLVSCVKSRLDRAATAEELFVSQWFRLARAYSQARGRWLILSAKYGLTEPSTLIQPHQEAFPSKGRSERLEWAKAVVKDLLAASDPGDLIVILAGQKYWENLKAPLEDAGRQIETPFAGLALSQQVDWLESQLAEIGAVHPGSRQRSPEEKLARRQRRAARRQALKTQSAQMSKQAEEQSAQQHP